MSRKLANQPALNHYPFWTPRFWHGMTLGTWLRLVGPRCHRIHPLRVPMALIVTGCAAVNSVLHLLQQLCFGRAIAETPLDHPPVFILGHWRSGTTYLHELLALDDRFAFPTTYECFAPNHFVLTGRILPRLLGFLLPTKRPNDDMAVSFAHPQEDEFAMVSMGAPSPMLRLAFPNDPPPYLELLDMEGVAPEDLQRWKQSLLQFVRMQTYLKGKPIVLKSPPHTGRLQVLAELFPEAKFIHLVRDPALLFPSTRRLWYALESVQGFQVPRYEQLDEYVLSAFERMYGGFERQRACIESSRICDLRYEDLVRDPIGQIERLYERLGLGDFERVRDKIARAVQERQSHRTTPHVLEDSLQREIRRRWSGYFEKYGYGAPSIPSADLKAASHAA